MRDDLQILLEQKEAVLMSLSSNRDALYETMTRSLRDGKTEVLHSAQCVRFKLDSPTMNKEAMFALARLAYSDLLNSPTRIDQFWRIENLWVSGTRNNMDLIDIKFKLVTVG